MKTYKIIHEEKLSGYFYIEANSPEEAIEEYNYMIENGQIDFSDLEMYDSEDYVAPEDTYE